MSLKIRAMNPSQNETYLTVTELNSLASQALASQFGLVWLRAEIGTFTRAASGHLYMTLKDASSIVKAVMFRSRASLCEFEPAVGDSVLVQARVGLYEPRGDFQLNVQVMRPDGRGTLYEQFQQIRSRLQAEGLFDPGLKRSVPLHPRAIGVVTSLAAAALHDVLTTLARRAPHVPVIIYPASVQGVQAPLQLRQALAQANERMEVDVILLVRGGGSIEDLWAFSDESLARDVAASTLPVICGVGHESDVSIADFAADLRAPTPTAAAELCCASVADLLANVRGGFERLQLAMARKLERWYQRVDQLSYGLVSPSQRLAAQSQALLRLESRLAQVRPDTERRSARVQALEVALRHGFSRQMQLRESRLAMAVARLQSLAPQAILDRGFAIVRDVDGKLLTSSASLAPGQGVKVQLAKGAFEADVRNVV
ncbi:exodeoxyribonuclease VII large subunit [Orrella marina]|uniref:exodeoxyribonuclease VII large subunit n=1 Tax=Orrella marina TaxID=2163011 RepID=UPI0038990CF4